jgi:hypothetical protein
MRKLHKWRGEQLVFLDESEINAKSGERTYCYGPKGKIIYSKAPAIRADNYSVLPAKTMNGYIACNIYHGVVNAEIFKAFVHDDVLPKCSSFPGPRSIIIVANATIDNVRHHPIYKEILMMKGRQRND